MALALYRRYRPDTFDGVIGQKQVTEPLCRALDTGRLTHAYLFSGPRGCGKTSSARILARCANCAKGPTSHPCGECDSCRELGRGGSGSLDVIEIDAASHNGVEDARDLRDKVAFGPTRDRYKIVILDEAHMVTASAFNALLKVVEEPPDNVMFIFATTEPDKVIGTIRSRTHHYPFRLVPPEVMGPYLEDVCHAEQVEPAPGVLRLVMRAGGGSVRDTLSVLDQLMAGAQDGAITYEQAVRLLGFTPDSLVSGAVDALIAGDGAALYGIVNKVAVGGYEPSKFVDDLLSRVRDLMILTLAGERAESTLSDSVRAEDMADLTRQAGALGLPRLSWMAETVNDALERMAGATSPRMRLELLAARLLAGPSPVPQAASGAPVQDTAAAPERSPRHARAEASPSPQRRSEADEIRDLSRDLSRIMADGTAPQGSARPEASSGPAALGASGSAQPEASVNAPFPSAAPGASGSAQPVPPTGPVTPEAAQPVPSPLAASGSARPAPLDATDRTWDALVAALPADARIHLDRSQVPRVTLEENGTRGRLYLTFATPLAQLAFSLSVCDGRPVASLTVDAVHRAFGPHVGIAPTPQAANGETATPFKRMTPDEQRNARSDAAEYTRLLKNRAAMPGQPSASGSAEPADDTPADSTAPTPGPLPPDAANIPEGPAAPAGAGDAASAPPVLPESADSTAAPAEGPAEPGQAALPAPEPASAAPALAAEGAIPEASSPAAPAENQAPAARPAPRLPQSDAETDAMWDGLVASLPENARIYLTRAQVPQVKLQRSQKNPAKARLILKFATPLAQTAFSLASCGERPVSAVAMEAVHASFGEGIGIAPAAHAANGEQVTPFSKMSDEERQNARRQVIGYTLTLQNAQGVGAASALKTPRAPRQDGDAPAASPAAGGDDAEADPWAGQESLAQVRAQEAREAGEKPRKKVAVPAADDTTDPWAGQQGLAERQAAARQTPADAQPGAFRGAQTTSPDDDAPAWSDSQTDANHGQIGALPATQPGASYGQPGIAGGAQPSGDAPLAPSRRDAALAAAASLGASHGIGTQTMQAAPSQGAVAVDEDGDEYSIDDSDLVTSLTIDEIARRLHATEVRDLSAADAA